MLGRKFGFSITSPYKMIRALSFGTHIIDRNGTMHDDLTLPCNRFPNLQKCT